MDCAPGYLAIPPTLQYEIDEALSTLPQIRGKVIILIEVNCSAPGAITNITFKKSMEFSVRP